MFMIISTSQMIHSSCERTKRLLGLLRVTRYSSIQSATHLFSKWSLASWLKLCLEPRPFNDRRTSTKNAKAACLTYRAAAFLPPPASMNFCFFLSGSSSKLPFSMVRFYAPQHRLTTDNGLWNSGSLLLAVLMLEMTPR